MSQLVKRLSEDHIEHWGWLLARSHTQSSLCSTHALILLFLLISLPIRKPFPLACFFIFSFTCLLQDWNSSIDLPQDNVNRINKPQWLYQSVCSSSFRSAEGALVLKYIQYSISHSSWSKSYMWETVCQVKNKWLACWNNLHFNTTSAHIKYYWCNLKKDNWLNASKNGCLHTLAGINEACWEDY